MSQLWTQIINILEGDLSAQQFHSWIRPLVAIEEDGVLRIQGPSFILERVEANLKPEIQAVLNGLVPNPPKLKFELGNYDQEAFDEPDLVVPNPLKPKVSAPVAQAKAAKSKTKTEINTRLNPNYTFDSFVEGKANNLAAAAAKQVAEAPGGNYNPLFIYGGVGLGKTHIMHAIGNEILARNPNARVAYLHSENFVSDMVTALRHNKIDEFKRFYRSLDALLIDDIQFFANKEQSQEEFFHTFNTLLEGNKQVVLTSDRFARQVDGLEDRLKSRFSWGLQMEVEPPEFEMRVAILMKKAIQSDVMLPEDVAFFIAKRLRGNVRDLEGALNRVIAMASFIKKPITIDLVKDALKDLFALQQKMVTLENILKTTADYFKLRVSDLLSKKRTRNIARPRQMVMALAKDLTSHSLPEIGELLGGRDHTTILHGVRTIKKLRETDHQVDEDFNKLVQIITS